MTAFYRPKHRRRIHWDIDRMPVELCIVITSIPVLAIMLLWFECVI